MSTYEKKNLIKSTNGRFFRVTFIKADGTIRKMIARIGCKIGVKGTGHALKVDNIVRVFDIIKREWRSIPLDRLIDFKCGREVVFA